MGPPLLASSSCVRRYVPADSSAVLAFRRDVYGPHSPYADPRFLRWLCEPPGLYGTPSPLWLCDRGSEILGQVAGRQVRLKIGDGEVDARWLTEFITSPAARNLGVGTALTETMCAESPVALALEVSDAARSILKRQGWIDLAAPALYVRPFDVAALLRDRGIVTWSAARAAVALLYRGFDAIERAVVAGSGAQFVPVEHFDERVDRLWTEVSPSYPVAVRRDAAYLNWRYVEFPRAGSYELHYLLKHDRLAGWAVTRRSIRHQRPSGELVDFFCAPALTHVLLAHALAHMRARCLFAAYCLHLNARARSAFRLLGFAQRSSGWAFMIRVGAEASRYQSLLLDRRRWFITAGDSNVDRPRDDSVADS